MLVDIIYDDMDYFWNNDYKNTLVNDYPNYMGDKHSEITYGPLIEQDLLSDPKKSMKQIEEGLNRDYVSGSYGAWMESRLRT
jgi:hypothetical protein